MSLCLAGALSDRLISRSGLPEELLAPGAGLSIAAVVMCLLAAGLAVDVVLAARLLRAGPRQAWKSRAANLLARPWTWRDIALITAVFLGLHLAAPAAGRALAALRLLPACWLNAFALIFLSVYLGGLAAICLLMRRRGMAWRSAFGLEWRSAPLRLAQGFFGYLAILPPIVAVSAACNSLLSYFGYPIVLQDIMLLLIETRSPGALCLLLILALFFAPLFEEAFFRGVIMPPLARGIGLVPAGLLSAALFAVIHFHAPSAAALFVLASGCAAAYIATGSLLVPVVMHALFNGMNIATVFLAMRG